MGGKNRLMEHDGWLAKHRKHDDNTEGRGGGGGMQVGAGPLEFAGQAEVLTVRAARQSSHQRRISEGDLAVCGGHA